MKVHHTHRITPTPFGRSFDYLQRGTLQRIRSYIEILENFLELMHRHKVLNFKNNTWVRIYIKD
jgi:hypothetical protein